MCERETAIVVQIVPEREGGREWGIRVLLGALKFILLLAEYLLTRQLSNLRPDPWLHFSFAVHKYLI